MMTLPIFKMQHPRDFTSTTSRRGTLQQVQNYLCFTRRYCVDIKIEVKYGITAEELIKHHGGHRYREDENSNTAGRIPVYDTIFVPVFPSLFRSFFP